MSPRRRALSAACLVALAACGGSVETSGTGGSMSTSSNSASSSGSASTSSSASSTSTSSTTSSSSSSTTSSSSTSSTSSSGVSSCTWAQPDPCGPGLYCDAPGCGTGTCKPVGTVEQGKGMAVCGCDGVTYWNASVAASHGMAVLAANECAQPKTCGGFGGGLCPAGSWCNYHISDEAMCGASDIGGKCWALPAVCDTGVGFGPQTRACGSPTCADVCDLIKLQTPWYDDNGCPK